MGTTSRPLLTGDRLPTLRADRVELRWLEERDVDDLFAIFSDRRVMRYWSSPPLDDRAGAEVLLGEVRSLFASGQLYQWGVARREDDRVIGTCTLTSIDLSSGRAEIGYALASGAWGHGYMAEALERLLDYAFGELGLRRLEADVDPRNAASIRSLERLGFRYEGHLEERWVVGGEVQDSLLYGLLARDRRRPPASSSDEVEARRGLVVPLVRAVGAELAASFRRTVGVRKKGAVDLVTDADLAAERHLVDGILAHVPDDAIVAEEGSGRAGTSGYSWIVDPLDGTTNFAHGVPQFGVSVALARGREVELGVVYDPMRRELFEAVRGRGAFVGSRRLEITRRSALDDAIVATGFAYDRRQRAERLVEWLRRAILAARGVRRFGAASLDLAWLAAGRLDLYYEDHLSPWDLAAGTLLVREAGGVTLAFSGAEWTLEDDGVVAGSEALVRELAARLELAD